MPMNNGLSFVRRFRETTWGVVLRKGEELVTPMQNDTLISKENWNDTWRSLILWVV